MTGQTPQNPAGIIVLPAARRPNPEIFYGQDDLYTLPITYPRFAHNDTTQVQLANGLSNGTGMGFIDGSAPASYLAEVASFEPGRTRLSGTTPGNFPQRAMAPAQWNAYVAATAGSEPQFAGGSGTFLGAVANPGTGA
jgi:hypothetical protein